MVSGRDFLGSYRLVKLVRAGQRTQVWEAIKDPDPTRIAVKVLTRDFAKDRESINELKHEAAVGQTLKHRNIIHIFEYCGDHELPFVAMELFNARNLKQDLREQSHRVAHLLPQIIRQGAEGLAHMHRVGWIHCDVKPDNFLVKDDGLLKLIDFSIAEKVKRGLAGIFGSRGKVRGTRSYMSPEQIRGKPLDPRSDVYSFGCVLFELMGGRPPYTADSPDDLLSKHLRAPIPTLAALNSAATEEFTDLVRRMMAKDREKRPESMDAFLKEFMALRVYRTGMKPRPPESSEQQVE